MTPLTKYKVNDGECLEFKLKAMARRAVAAALKDGLIKRPVCCDLCTLEHSKLEAHHVDYGSPLHVYWLCNTCHGVVHKKNHPLNPNNNLQTSTPTAWKRDENQIVSFAKRIIVRFFDPESFLQYYCEPNQYQLVLNKMVFLITAPY